MDGDQDNQVGPLASQRTPCMGHADPEQFASLTPLEPRLIKKILPPLTTLIRTTPAMSVLYECINGIIQGGVLHNEVGTHEVEEIASLCVTKLRSMIGVDGDPNRRPSCCLFKSGANFTIVKYVALLAFDYFIRSYPHLVSSQEDVIMECIDDPDISIRLKALALSEALVNVDSLVPLVTRLLQQLDRRQTPRQIPDTQSNSDPTTEVDFDSEDTPPEGNPKSSENLQREDLALTTDQRKVIIRYVIRMCSTDNYRNILDFGWYIDVLLRLIELSPSDSLSIESQWRDRNGSDLEDDTVSYALGWQLRNIAVRVEAVRSQTVAAAMWLLSRQHHCQTIDMRSISGAILSFAAWIAGEYIAYGRDAQSILDSLLCPDITSLHPTVICSYLQAIPKVFAHLVSKVKADWSTEDRTMIDLQVTRIIYMLEPLTFRSELEVQERAVGFFELFKIVSQALQAEENAGQPLLLTKALPHLFNTHELHPVAPSAQRKVPPPGKFDLDACINPDLLSLLQVQPETPETSMVSSYELFYHARASQESRATPILAPVPSRTIPSHSYQQTEKARSNAPAPKREEHEDPFYIQYQGNGFNGRSPLHEVIQASNGSHIDIDAIPIMNLELEPVQSSTSLPSRKIRAQDKQERSKIRVAEDVTVEDFEKGSDLNSNAGQRIEMKKRNVLGVNSHEIGNISLLGSAGLEDGSDSGLLVHDAEMSKAIADVERLRLEMQRASERVEVSDGVPAEGTLVKKKKRRQPKGPAPTAPEHFEGSEADLTSRGKPRRLKKKRQKSPPDTTLSIPVKEEMND